MLEYNQLKRTPRKFLALTGLTNKEFKILLLPFVEVYQNKHQGPKTQARRKRKREVGGGRKGQLKTMEQKLLFILVHQKTYPVQVVLGELFGLSQASANEWVHRLLPLLREALIMLEVMPERDGRQFAQTERRKRETADYIIDGTERRRQRPKTPRKQGQHYSGKKKMHTDKNVIITQTRSKRVGYLSPTHAGQLHDKKIADRAQISYPRTATLRKDTGFQGYEPLVKHSYQPKKNQRVKNLPRVTSNGTRPCHEFG